MGWPGKNGCLRRRRRERFVSLTARQRLWGLRGAEPAHHGAAFAVPLGATVVEDKGGRGLAVGVGGGRTRDWGWGVELGEGGGGARRDGRRARCRGH